MAKAQGYTVVSFLGTQLEAEDSVVFVAELPWRAALLAGVYPNRIGNFHKTLPHNSIGEVFRYQSLPHLLERL